jgi:uncharacterized membrane protein
MVFFLGLVSVYGILWVLSLLGINALADNDLKGTIAAAIVFAIAGVLHFIFPKKYLMLMPRDLWHKEIINYAVGIAEIILGIGLLFDNFRVNAAYGLTLLLIFVFPANVKIAFKKGGPYYISRLFFQPVFIGWLFWFCILRTA